MGPDDDDADEWRAAGPPLPPDDRLWRHPSELRQHGVPGGAVAAPAPVDHPGRRPAWPVLLAGLTGAVLATGALAAVGVLEPRVVERAVVEKVAVTPVVSSPVMAGSDDVRAVVQRVGPAVAHLEVRHADGSTGSGSAIIYRDDGLLLTSAEVVRDAASIDVLLGDGRRLTGRLVGADAMTDVAVVSVEAEDLPVALLATTGDVEVGAVVITIGAAEGADGSPSVATGVISGVRRRVEIASGRSLHGMLQADAPVGDSAHGGALLDASGAVIGIAAVMADHDGSPFCFATPIEVARTVAAHLVADGRMVHGWLGVQGTDLAIDLAKALGVGGGALVQTVSAGSPAAVAGLVPGDVITELAGTQVASISDLVLALREHRPGDDVSVGYWRAGAHTEVALTLGTHP